MHRYRYGCAAALLLALSPRALPAQDTTIVVVRGGTILPITGPEIKNGVLVVDRGKITAVGSADRVKIPAGAKMVDATGKVIMPGLIDTQSAPKWRRPSRPSRPAAAPRESRCCGRSS